MLCIRGVVRCCRRRQLSNITYTKDRYNVQRGRFGRLETRHYDAFESLLDAGRVLRRADDCDAFNVDWVRTLRGRSRCVLKPRTTAEVSAILRYCNEHRLAVCPQGGNTGLVGGSVPVFDEIIVSTSLMNQVLRVDAVRGALVCQAGCVLADLEQTLAAHRLMMPLDLGARGSCQIGGNISTSAGGVRLLRYGNLHANLIGIEAVTANGDVVDGITANSPLSHLFVGAEGTLGIVTTVALRCPPLPASTCVAYLGVASMAHVLAIYERARRHLAAALSAFELLDAASAAVVRRHLRKRAPLSDDAAHAFHLLIETQSASSSVEQRLEAMVADAIEAGHVADGVVSGEPSKVRRMWEIRELITSALRADGAHAYKYDLSVPHAHFYDIVDAMRTRLAGDAITVCGYGHVADANLHLNVTTAAYSEAIRDRIEPFVFEYTARMRGSISAEHGIGFSKAKYLHLCKSRAAIALMTAIKRQMDANGILNPYKVLPEGGGGL